MTNYDMIQLMPLGHLVEFLLDYGLKVQRSDKLFCDGDFISYAKITKWLTKDIKGDPAEWETEPISVLEIKPKIYEVLYTAGIHSLGDLIKLRAYDLLKIPHIGESGLIDVVQSLEKYTGWKLSK